MTAYEIGVLAIAALCLCSVWLFGAALANDRNEYTESLKRHYLRPKE